MPPAKPEIQGSSPARVTGIWPDLITIFRPRWAALAAGFCLMTLNSLSGLVLPYSTRFLIDEVIGKQQWAMLTLFVIAVVSATIVQALTMFALTRLLSTMGHRLVFELRQQVQQHIGRLPVSYFEKHKVGALVSRIMADVDGVRHLVSGGLLQFLGGLTTTAFAMLVMFWMSPLMTAIVAVFVMTYAYLAKTNFKRLDAIMQERGRIAGDIAGRLTESIGGVRVVKGYHAEEREAAAFAKGLRPLLENVLATVNTMSLMSASAIFLIGTVGATVWLTGAWKVRNGDLTVGELMTFVAFFAYLMSPVVQFVEVGLQLSEALAGLARTREVLNEIPEDQDPLRTIDIGPVSGKVAFDHVQFSYDGRRQVLRDICFEVAPGTVTALVGPSGAGKSTVIGLLAAFYKPGGGRILIDDVDLSTVRLDSYRTQIGVVLQDPILFDGTISENVAFSCASVSEQEIITACRIAHVDEFVQRFERGYGTMIGERGVRLSGGQRQRIAIARAILSDPRILILDEATSSLDSISETLIQEGLRFLMQRRTTIVIAHRLSTIRQANQILVMEKGAIVERGSHDSLCLLRKHYWELYTRQQGLQADVFRVV